MHVQRPKLQSIVEHRPRRRRANRRGAPAYPRRSPVVPASVRESPAQPATPPHPQIATPASRSDLLRPDVALRRVRESGGPLDHASYACQCGYFFEADVSTTVTCPHCATPQAW
jgi:hypothetical protein